MAVRVTYDTAYGKIYSAVSSDMSRNYEKEVNLFFQGQLSATVTDLQGVVHCLNPRFVFEVTLEVIPD